MSTFPILAKPATDVARWLAAARQHGAIVLVDKAQRWTSFDVVAKLRRMLHVKKVGHAGTLDPLATGLLIVCIGRATRQVNRFQALDKEYEVEIKLGATTPSDDAETPETSHYDISGLTDAAIHAALQQFVGTYEQVPPAYSAVHVGGKRLYELARRGEELPTLPPRQVTIYSITDVAIALPYVRCRVRCSKGTFIRALARDLGATLGVGGYVTALRRTAIGDYRVEQAFTIQELQELFADYRHADVSLHR